MTLTDRQIDALRSVIAVVPDRKESKLTLQFRSMRHMNEFAILFVAARSCPPMTFIDAGDAVEVG